jgi:hypothetical protein
MAMRNGLLLLVSVVALVSGVLLIFFPGEPCSGTAPLFVSSCSTSTLSLFYAVWGGLAALIGIGGLIVSIRTWPGQPILPSEPIRGSRSRTLLVVSVTAIVSGLLILFPSGPCAGARALFAASGSCTTSGLTIAYVVWGSIAVLVGLIGVLGSIRVWPSEPA